MGSTNSPRATHQEYDYGMQFYYFVIIYELYRLKLTPSYSVRYFDVAFSGTCLIRVLENVEYTSDVVKDLRSEDKDKDLWSEDKDKDL